jgi:hypothetical protein
MYMNNRSSFNQENEECSGDDKFAKATTVTKRRRTFTKFSAIHRVLG